MAEYINVEKPFLDKFRQLGWEVIDQGIGVPQDSTKSLRENFKQVLLPQVLLKTILRLLMNELQIGNLNCITHISQINHRSGNGIYSRKII